MRTLNSLALILFFILITYACQKDSGNTSEISKSFLKGIVQKGPFLNGTSIVISELNNKFEQTGKVYNTQIDNGKGSFVINNISLSSQYVALQANGFYFNEITGTNSIAQISLSALTDLTDSSTININILSTLEKKRVEYLISKGKSFKESKNQARSELLKVFSITKANMISPEYLDISKEGEDNAILLAVSSIIQGYRSESELTEMIADISEDIRLDGKLDNSSLGTTLINHARFLDGDKIRTNLQNKYKSLNMSVNIPHFEKYLKQFVDSTSFIFTDSIQYPDFGKSGANVLSYNKLDFSDLVNDSIYKVSLAAHVPKLATVKVKVKFSLSAAWAIDPTNSGWNVDTHWDIEPRTFVFTKDNSKEDLDLKMRLIGTGTAKIEIFENNIVDPVRVKEIKW